MFKRTELIRTECMYLPRTYPSIYEAPNELECLAELRDGLYFCEFQGCHEIASNITKEYVKHSLKVVAWCQKHNTEEKRVSADSSASLYSLVMSTIKGYKPFRQYKHEDQYQIDLARELKRVHPGVVIEQQKGSSRPDIVIESIAIEVKGPTTTQSLQTIADKIVRYSTRFATIIVVLFDKQLTQTHYDEWCSGISHQFPKVQIIDMSQIDDPIMTTIED